MKAQTYLDVVRGLEMINDRTWKATHRDEMKAEIATEAGALILLDEVNQIVSTLRQVIDHDSGHPISFTLMIEKGGVA